MKSYNGKIKTEFHDIEIFFSIILTDSVLEKYKSYLRQGFLEGCKYIVEKKKEEKKIYKDYDLINYFSDEETSDKEGCN